MNTYRLYEHIRLVRRVRKAVDEDLSMGLGAYHS